MPTQVQFRRGNSSQNNNFKGAAGEISFNTLTNSLRVHNGITTGGFELARADLSNVTVSIGSSQWITTSLGIHTFGNVSIGTITPNANLHIVGTAATALLVEGNARITGILTIGTSSITLDGNGNNIIIGSGVTVYGTTGIVSATAIYAGGVNLAASSGYATTAGIATYASTAGIATYSSTTGIATYANTSGIATYSSTSGIATYSTRAGIATYANTSGIATYSSTAGIATYSSTTGIATYASTAGIATVAGSATYAQTSGIATVAVSATYAQTTGIATFATTSGLSTTSLYTQIAGIATYAQTAGIATVAVGFGTTSSINTTGIITASKFVGDGSGLSGIVASGSGIEIRDSGSLVGTAATIDFGDYLDVNFGSGIATVTAIIPAGSGSSDWVRTGAGIHTLGKVGIGTTNPVSVLSIGGTTGVVFTQSDIKVSISSVTTAITGIVTAYVIGNLINSQANQNYTVTNRSGSLSGTGFTATLYRNSIGLLNGHSIGNGGSGFVVGERIIIPGNLIGGSTPTNDLRITVTSISGGSVTGIDLSFSIVPGAANQSYTVSNLSGNLSGTGFIFYFTRNSSGGLAYWGDGLAGTKNFSLYERITVPGNLVGGTSPTDDINLTVTGIKSETYNTIGKNIFIGQGAGKSNIPQVPIGEEGRSNNFIGWYAGPSNTTGKFNNFFGDRSGYTNTTGDSNIFLGSSSGYYNTTSYRNSFIGRDSGYYNTTGSWNNFVGSGSGYYNTIGGSNSFFGSNAGYYNTTGSYNSSFGNGAGHYNQSGCFNTFLGNYTGLSTSASYKVVIGSGEYWGNNFDSPDITKDYQLAIGIRTDANLSKYWLVGDENFNIGIGTTNPSEKLSVGGNIFINQTTLYGSVQASTASTVTTGIHSGLSTSVYRSVEYTIQASQGSNYQAIKILAIHDGTNAYDTQYGNIYNTEVAAFDVDISGGNVRLVATASSTSTTNYIVNFIATRI